MRSRLMFISNCNAAYIEAIFEGVKDAHPFWLIIIVELRMDKHRQREK